MATVEAQARRLGRAQERIIQAVQSLAVSGGLTVRLPSNRDPAAERILQMEALAEILEGIAGAAQPADDPTPAILASITTLLELEPVESVDGLIVAIRAKYQRVVPTVDDFLAAIAAKSSLSDATMSKIRTGLHDAGLLTVTE